MSGNPFAITAAPAAMKNPKMRMERSLLILINPALISMGRIIVVQSMKTGLKYAKIAPDWERGMRFLPGGCHRTAVM